jgi:alkylation response protein AidB-like acyl-CoA dehydrogenase
MASRRLPRSGGRLIGRIDAGLQVALRALEIFRPTVGAAATGFARRALDEALQRSLSRRTFGKPLAEHQMIQAKLADMATELDAATLLVYRAAWNSDVGGRSSREASMAKLHATESAHRIIDMPCRFSVPDFERDKSWNGSIGTLAHFAS